MLPVGDFSVAASNLATVWVTLEGELLLGLVQLQGEVVQVDFVDQNRCEAEETCRNASLEAQLLSHD